MQQTKTYSITSSARASSMGGTSRLSALAVLRLMTNSTLVDCSTGSSAGFSPLNAGSINAPTARCVAHAGSVAHQATSPRELRSGVDRRNGVTGRKAGDVFALVTKGRIRPNEQRPHMLFDSGPESSDYVAFVCSLQNAQLKAKGTRRLMRVP
jgi:hypothetical protein